MEILEVNCISEIKKLTTGNSIATSYDRRKKLNLIKHGFHQLI